MSLFKTKNINEDRKKPKTLKRFHDQIKKHAENKKERKLQFIDPISSIQNFSGEERHAPIKTIKNSDDTHILYDNHADTYFKTLSTEEYLKKIKIHFINIIEKLKNTRSS